MPEFLLYLVKCAAIFAPISAFLGGVFYPMFDAGTIREGARDGFVAGLFFVLVYGAAILAMLF